MIYCKIKQFKLNILRYEKYKSLKNDKKARSINFAITQF